MFKTQKPKRLLAALLAFFCFSNSSYASDADDETYARLKKSIRARLSRSTSIVLGPNKEGKSTLINMLMHSSEYATLEKKGEVLIDSDDYAQAIYHQALFEKKLSFNPWRFAEATLPKEFESVPGIARFVPILGPVAVLDFMLKLSENYFEIEKAASSEDGDGRTRFPEVYHSHSKVKNPAFQSTIIDAPGISYRGRLEFLRNVIEEVPQNPGQLNGFLLVIGADTLAKNNLGPDNFNYYIEIKKILEQIDPSFDRVFLVITKAGNNKFLSMVGHSDPRRIVSEKFKHATSIMDGPNVKEAGMVIPSERIFFFENQYNCLSESSIDKLYNCEMDSSSDPKVELANTHRVKNYKLNVVESFNLLKALANKNPVSRADILEQIDSALSSEAKMPSVTWTNENGKNPSDILVSAYKCEKIGKQVMLYWRIHYKNPGDSVVRAQFRLPSDCPRPVQWSNHDRGYSYTGVSVLSAGFVNGLHGDYSSTILDYNDVLSKDWAIWMTRPATRNGVLAWWGQITYPTAE